MNINRYALCKERSLQKIISKQPKPNTTAIGVCSETHVTHHIITKRSDECLPISVYVPKHKEGDGKKFPVIIDIYGGKDDSWTEAILYDDTGREVTVTEPCDGFTGCWELKDEDANTVYRAHVMTKPNLN